MPSLLTVMKSTILLSFVYSSMAFAAPPSGREVLERQEATRKLPTFEASSSLSTTKEGETTKAVKKFRWSRKLGDDSVHYVSLVRFDEPATIRGEGILMREGAKENDVRLYLPRFKKVRRVEGQSQSSSFFGSAFSYADVAVPHADENNAKILKAEKCPGAELMCWVMETTPANDSVRDRYGYSRTVQWVRQDNWVTVSGEFYDKKGVLWKRLTASDVTEIDTKQHKWLALTLKMDDIPAKKTSIVKLSNVKANHKLENTLFTEQSLSNE